MSANEEGNVLEPRVESKHAAAPASHPSKPTRRPSGARVLLWVVLASLLIWIGHAFGDGFAQLLGRAVAAFRTEGGAAGEAHAEGHQYYTCGMHPWVVLPAPGDCPICHMALTPLDPSKFSGTIAIDPVVTQNIGVRTTEVVRGPLVRTIRTVGKVDYDETGVRDVNTRVEGWIEKLHVDYMGARVEAGEPLFELFSRELYSAQEEYLIAWRAAQRSPSDVGFVPEVGRDRESNLQATRRRLLLYGISAAQIERLEQEGTLSQTMTIQSPGAGVVTEKHAYEGMRVTPDMLTYRIADLSKVWVIVTLYEYQLPFVHEGQAAEMTLPYIPGQRFEGKVTYIYPWLEEKTREVRVRMEFENPGLLLKPGMFTTVELKARLAEERTLAPREAILDTGERQLAFVALGRGRFEPRDVRMGVQAEGGMVEVVEGLRPGEQVVTSGQFLLDSEARIREALAKMVGAESGGPTAGVASAGAGSLPAQTPELASALSRILERYFAIQAELAGDRWQDSPSAARELAAAVDGLLELEVPDQPHFWHEHDQAATIRGKALQLAGVSELEAARLRFGDLSVALASLIDALGVPASFGQPVRELHCPMYREGQGGSSWLQATADVRNPYFGSRMLECYDEERALPVQESPAAARRSEGDAEVGR